MASMLRDKRELSQVVTTLIILVVSVLLAGIVQYYATNITMTRTQQEDAAISKEHVWVNSSGSVAAFKLQNLGGRDLLIDKIAVRSVECKWSKTYFWRVPGGVAVTGDLQVVNPPDVNGTQPTANITIDGSPRTFERASTDIPLVSGGVIIFYIGSPGNISVDDIGKTTSLTVFTMNAQYIVECSVRPATRQPQGQT